MLAEASQRQHDLQTQVDALSAKLASVQDFQRRQVEVEEEMLRLKEDNQSLRERLEQQRAELERCLPCTVAYIALSDAAE